MERGVREGLPAPGAGMVRQVPEMSNEHSRSSGEASVAAALEALRANRPLRTELICREYLEQTRAPWTTCGCLAMRSASSRDTPRRSRSYGRHCRSSRSFRTCTRTWVACSRCSSASRKPCPASSGRSGSSRVCRSRTRSWAGAGALGRGARRIRLSRSSSTRRRAWQGGARARSPARRSQGRGIETLRTAVREDAGNVDALRVLAQVYWREDKQLSDAEALLRRVASWRPVTRWPECSAACCTRPTAIPSPSRPTWRRRGWIPAIRSPGPVSASPIRTPATCRAIEAFERSLAPQPLPNVHLSYGHALKTRGDQAAAFRAYREGIAGKPDFGEV